MKVLCCTFLSYGSKTDVVILKMAHGLGTSHPVHKAMQFMAQRAWEKSDSTLVIEIYPNKQLGNEKECLEKLQLGHRSNQSFKQHAGELSRRIQSLRAARRRLKNVAKRDCRPHHRGWAVAVIRMGEFVFLSPYRFGAKGL